MAWKVEISAKAAKEFEKLNPQSKKLIKEYIDNRILQHNNPQKLGKALHRDLKGLWRYRVENFRIICQIKERELVLLIIKVAHRKEVYD